MESITLDLNFMGAEHIISSHLLATGDGGFVLLETGPASTLGTLEEAVVTAGFELDRLQALFLTHVHLDHSGGAGTLAQRTGCAVYAHPEGAHHLVDPGDKLLPSAERLYGDMMVPLWGRIEPVPESRLEVVEHGASIRVGELELIGWHTPGHAVHHVAWQVGDAVATGDVAGVRFPGSDHVLPPMPPPDIDVELWLASLDLLRGLGPRRLLLTHFGAFDDPARHLDDLEGRLRRWDGIADEVVAAGGSKEELAGLLSAVDEREMADARVPASAVERYHRLCPMDGNSAGLFRYRSKKADKAGK